MAEELDRLGCKRAVVFCGKTLSNDDNAAGLLRDALGARHAGTFSGVQPHSPLPAVLAGLQALQDLKADAVIPFGGGSAIVTARAATILLAEGRSLHELCTKFPAGKPPVSPKLLQPKLPQLAVPSTPTTAFAKAGTAVADPGSGRRLTLFDPKTRASAIFFHPAIIATASPGLVLDAALNAFAMAVQGLEGKARDPLADALLLHAIRLLCEQLPRLRSSPADHSVREQLMFAALLSGQGTDYSGGGVASVIGHCVGARFHLDNGIVNSILLPHAMRYNAPATGTRLNLLLELFAIAGHSDETSAMRAASATESFLSGLGLPRRLRDIGVPDHALPQIADDAMTDWFLHQNPRKIRTSEDLIDILRAAW